MASTLRILASGLSLAGNTVALIAYALAGGAVFTRITLWLSSYAYDKPPVIDPGVVQWIFPGFFAFLLILEVVLIWATVQAIFSRKVYYSEQGY